MEKIQFGDSETRYLIHSIQPVAVHIMQIIYDDVMPDETVYAESMTLYTSEDIKETTLAGWNTIYYCDDENKTVWLSDDESVYTEPQEPEPEPEPEPYEPTIEELQTYKISEMQTACANAIKAGIDVDGEHFTLDSEARLALIVKEMQILEGDTEIDFYPDGEPSKYYTAEEMEAIIEAANSFIDGHSVYCNELCLWIKTLTDAEEIEEVYYGIEIPETHRSEVLEKILPVGDDETGMLPQEGKDDDSGDNSGDDNPSDDSSDDDSSDDSGNANVGAGDEVDAGGTV